MVFRRIFAGFIVALLVAISAFSVACELSCAFASTGSDCHLRQAKAPDSAPGGMKMDGMDMSGMSMPEMAVDGDRQTGSAVTRAAPRHASIGEMGPCERQACDDGAAVSSRTSHSVDSRFIFVVARIASSTAGISHAHFHDAREDIARDRRSGASPLPLSLRI